MTIFAANLKDQTGVPGPHPILYCEYCGSETSANKGDYFYLTPDYSFVCCEQPMTLAIKRVTYEKVNQ